MTTFLTPLGIPQVTVTLSLNGQNFEPTDGYILGVLQPGDKIAITLEIAKGIEHRCHVLSFKNSEMVTTPKAVINGKYVKNLTVTTARSEKGVRSTQIASWPNNMLCLEIGDKTYNIGIFNRHGKYFFAVVEKTNPIETNSALPIGFVTHFDVLRGVARVYTGHAFQEARLHWSHMPFRKALGFRAIIAGEVITIKEACKTGAEKTSFSEEIKACILA